VPTAAFTVNGAAKMFQINISGSSANGIASYGSVSVTGNQATADVSLVNPKAAPQLTAQIGGCFSYRPLPQVPVVLNRPETFWYSLVSGA
jgi:hypothetical protein